jgi:DNA-binding XRE family transcriptional regulator
MSSEFFNFTEENFKEDKNRLKFIRKKFHISSQSELAERVGLAIHKIKDIESGKVKISVEIASLIEEKFNFKFKWLLTGKGEMYESQVPKGANDVAPVEKITPEPQHRLTGLAELYPETEKYIRPIEGIIETGDPDLIATTLEKILEIVRHSIKHEKT